MSKKLKLLLYCTKTKGVLRKLDNYFLDEHNDNYYWKKGQTIPYNVNGKIVAECDFEVEKIGTYSKEDIIYLGIKQTQYDVELLEQSCLSNQQMNDYLKLGSGYAIYIKNLHIFDEPKELSEYYGLIPKKVNTLNGSCYINESIDNAPQNMMYAIDDNDNEYILISIQPQWLCKILNGEKTIEVRKKVLKEMMG